MTSTPDAIELRPFVAADAPVIFALSQEAGMRAWLPDQVYADLAQAERVIAYLMAQYAAHDPRTAPIVFAVCERATGAVVGHVGLSAAGADVEIGYAIGDAHVGRGYATAAVRAMVAHGLVDHALPAVVGIVAVANAGSCRVLEKAGFALVGEAERAMHGHTQRVRTYRITRL